MSHNENVVLLDTVFLKRSERKVQELEEKLRK